MKITIFSLQEQRNKALKSIEDEYIQRLNKFTSLKVSDLYNKDNAPKVLEGAGFKEIINEISSKMLGATAVISSNNEILGIITDGDIRRMLEKHDLIKDLKASDIMTKNPVSLDSSSMAIEAATVMTERKITQIIVTENERYKGIVHFHDLNNEGIS